MRPDNAAIKALLPYVLAIELYPDGAVKRIEFRQPRPVPVPPPSSTPKTYVTHTSTHTVIRGTRTTR